MTVEVTRADRSNVRWLSPSSGLWVATRHDEYAGMVERLNGRLGARDALGHDLGSFDDLDSAMTVVDRGGVQVLAGSTRAHGQARAHEDS